ncbi:hypothetical protein CAL7716_059640 [Calothrix sp. PCC 7716]|nr:hypothetical protein CAL7716_059640 [Calothrix sp. PCC 7716]
MSNLLLEASDINTTPERLKELAYKDTNFELARAVALNPSAPPDLLEALVYLEDEELCRNIATNPNTPVDILFEVGAEFPRELINNPVFPLLLLENSSLFLNMPFSTIASILSLDDVPEAYLMKAVEDYEDDEVLSIVANHVKAPEEALNKIINCSNQEDEEYFAAILNVNYNNINAIEGWKNLVDKAIHYFYFLRHIPEKELFLYNLGIFPEKFLPGLYEKTRISIAANPKTPKHIKNIINKTLVDKLSKKELKLAKAGNPDTPINTLIQLSNSPLIYIKETLAENPSIPIHVLEKLAHHTNALIVAGVCDNYNVTDSILKIAYQHEEIAKIITSKDSNKNPVDILSVILKNHSTHEFTDGCIDFDSITSQNFCIYLSLEKDVPNEIFQAIGTVSNINLLIALARHPKTPVHLFEHVYKRTKDKTEFNYFPHLRKYYNKIRIFLSKNPQTPIHILFKLLQDDCCKVRGAAIHNIQTNFASYNQNVVEFLRELEQANNPKSSPDTLLTIANDRNVSLCFAVAQNPNTPASALDKLAFHKSRDVRLAVTNNPNTTVDTLVFLSKKRKGCFHIRQSAVKALIDKDPKRAGAVLAEFVNSPDPSVPRFIFLLHELAPVEFLEKHANSIWWLERYAVAQNNSTPIHIRNKLKNDANRIVRAAACGRNIGAF